MNQKNEQQYNIDFNIYRPFGPSVLHANLPQILVDAINTVSNDILDDEKKRKEKDYSQNLAGNVKYEIQFPMDKLPAFGDTLTKLVSGYVDNVLTEKERPKGDYELGYKTWVVSQYAGDFNPVHIHDANLSGVMFLKMPEKYEEEYRREDHHPTVGCLEFLGSMPGHFSKHSYLVKPVIGDVYLFPSQLAHQVYPFRSEGERRSLAFNVHFSLKKQSDQPVKDARSLGVS